METLNNNNSIQTSFAINTEWEQGFTGRLDIFNSGELVEDWTIEFESAFEIEPEMIWGAEVVSREGDRYTLKPSDYHETLNPQQEIAILFNANKVNGVIIPPTDILVENNIETGETPETSAVIAQGNLGDVVPENFLESTPETSNENDSEAASPETRLENVNSNLGENNPEVDLDAEVDFTLIKDWGSGFEGKISITNNTDGNLDSWSLEFDFPNPINNIWDAEIKTNDDGSYVITHTNWNREIAAGETLSFGFTGENAVTTEPQNFDLDGFVFDSMSRSESIYTFSNPDLTAELELNQEYQGRATFYDAANPAGGLGASGYDVPVSNQLHKVVAINNVQWNGSEASGAFFEVSGPKQRDGAAPITVQVVDYLYERADGFDMSAEAFERVAEPVDGIVNIEYQLVGPPDDYVTAYGYSIGQGIVVEGIAETNPYYAAVRLNNYRYPIESVDLIKDSGNMLELERESDNRFVLKGNYPLYGPQDLLVTDIFGQQVTLDNVDLTNGSSADIVTGKNFDLL